MYRKVALGCLCEEVKTAAKNGVAASSTRAKRFIEGDNCQALARFPGKHI